MNDRIVTKPSTPEYEVSWERIFGKNKIDWGDDGRCKCDVASPCPRGKTGTQLRCTKEGLK